MVKKTSQIILLSLFVVLTATAQKREKYEFIRNLPVYADSLIADLTYPMAWGNSEITDFDEWKRVARQKVFDCMLTPPPAPAERFDAKVLFEEQRDGYTARKIEIRLSKYYNVPAYVLIPDGKGPFPAVNALHDHGGHRNDDGIQELVDDAIAQAQRRDDEGKLSNLTQTEAALHGLVKS